MIEIVINYNWEYNYKNIIGIVSISFICNWECFIGIYWFYKVLFACFRYPKVLAANIQSTFQVLFVANNAIFEEVMEFRP